ncbi:protein NRT1/ PTR FAMILY 5.8-like [Phoenix dactylifera]|uniref:Protein NRT1/ PTR FAMILY 5.8-like n=1 Tax=Phoenix dactylifera TaxID=42345 RepID=A0A8B7C863_PHODC|nr:protein NRT1/ PTR FAMILY 5.8-like [Phoenix dactylifera]
MALEKRSTGLGKSCVLIIVVASVERFAYKGVASNLVTYLTDVVKMSTSSAAKSISTWVGLTSMLPLVSAILADSYWDRYSTIMASSLLYVMGLVGLTLWALLCARMPASSLFIPLYLISVGQGGYNPSLQAFGADQLEIEDNLPCSNEDKTSKKSLFFQWWYFGICGGSLLGNSTMSYIQDTLGWGLGFAIPTGAMAMSVACFLCGARFYVHKQLKLRNRPKESIVQALKAAANYIINRKLRLPSRDDDVAELELQEKPLRDDFSCSKALDTDFATVDEPPSVTKTILRLLPIWTMLLMFAVIFQQPATFFTKQGMMMKHNIGNFVIPPAMLQSSITISIILLMPLYDKLIIPFLRVFTRDENGITVLQRIGIGMCLSIVGMVVAALVESKRLGIIKDGAAESLSLKNTQLSIFWLLPQYILLGISDVFTVVGMQEFFYMQVPTTMRTIGIALYLSVFGVGSFLGALLISVVELTTGANGKNRGWLSDDARESRLDNYYWFLAVLSSISFLIFVNLSRCYQGSNASEK